MKIVKIIKFLVKDSHKEKEKQHEWFQVELDNGNRKPLRRMDIPDTFKKEMDKLINE